MCLVNRQEDRREEHAARDANRVLICDTNRFATRLWHRRYLGCESDRVKEVAQNAKCDLYLLSRDEIPFVQGGLRDGEHIRRDMHRWFEKALVEQIVPWRLVEVHEKSVLRPRFMQNQLFRQSRWLKAEANHYSFYRL